MQNLSEKDTRAVVASVMSRSDEPVGPVSTFAAHFMLSNGAVIKAGMRTQLFFSEQGDIAFRVAQFFQL